MLWGRIVYLSWAFNYNRAMQTWVYKGNRKANTYLYVAAEDDFSAVPQAILDLMGPLTFVMELDLATRDKLAQADIGEVRARLTERGFFIQLPPGDYVDPFDQLMNNAAHRQ